MSVMRQVSIEEFESEALPHLDDLFRTARRVLRDRTEAEDQVQEAYLQAWKSFHRFTPGTNCRAWLFKILFHVIHHHRRRMYSVRFVTIDDDSLMQDLTFTPPVPEHITDEDLLAALDRVPQAFREVLLLADVEEFSYREISTILRIPVGTVMSRLSRARGCMRRELTLRGTSVLLTAVRGGTNSRSNEAAKAV